MTALQQFVRKNETGTIKTRTVYPSVYDSLPGQHNARKNRREARLPQVFRALVGGTPPRVYPRSVMPLWEARLAAILWFTRSA